MILGGGPTREEAPLDDTTIEKWVLPVAYPQAAPAATRCFEMHHDIFDVNSQSWDGCDNRQASMDAYKAILKEIRCPVYMIRKYDEVPASIPYPIKEICSRFGVYFDNSVSYMIAMAIHEGYHEMQFYGVDMQEEKMVFGKGSCEYLLGIAWAMGIMIKIPDKSSLMRPKNNLLYGYEIAPSEMFKEEIASIKKMEQEKLRAVQ